MSNKLRLLLLLQDRFYLILMIKAELDSTHRTEARSAESYILDPNRQVAEDSKFTQTVETLIAIRPRPNFPTIKPRELFFHYYQVAEARGFPFLPRETYSS